MGDESSSQVAPRKMKYAPKIPPPKVTKPAMPKTEPPGDAGTDVIDHKLLRLAKQFEQGSGKRLPKVERKVAPVQVAFGHGDAKGSIRSFGMPKRHHQHQDGADGSAPKIEKEYIEPWDYYSYYPVVLPLRRPYSGNPELLDEGEFGTASASSTYDEACIKPAEQLGLMDGNEAQMLFFQLPASLPLPKRPAAAQGKEVDSRVGNATEKGCSVKDLPAGFMGKLLVYKSGTVKMKLGDALFDVSPGLETVFSQDVMAINTQEKHCCVLGELNKRAVVTPDVDSLLDSISDLG